MNGEVSVPSVMSQHVSECVPGQQCVDSNAKIGTVVESDTAVHAHVTYSFSDLRTKFKSKNARTEAAVPSTLTLHITE